MGLSSLIFSKEDLQSFIFHSTKSEKQKRLAHPAPGAGQFSKLEQKDNACLLGIVFHFPRNMSDYTIFTEGDAAFVLL